MGCFPCFSSKKSESIEVNQHIPVIQTAEIARPALPSSSPAVQHKQKPSGGGGESKEAQTPEVGNIEAKTFTFRELATATKNFRQETLLGDGGFGKFYKGTLQPSGQVIAVKRLDRNGMQGNKEFLVEVFMLSLLKHPNILDLVGYCADGDQRLLVYDYMPLGSLESHLFDDSPDKKPLDWETRMKIASGAAQGLEYLHEKANPPVVYRDMKPTNILLGEGFEARLCDIGITKNAQSGNSTPPRVMNTHGYCAPEYTRTGEVTLKSDIYSFGVVLLELITGRRAMDPNRPSQEQNLVTWAQPIFRDPKRFPEMADPLLNGKFSVKCLNQAVGVAAMCLEEEPSVRPFITDVVAALSFLQLANKDETSSTNELLAPTPSLKGDDHHDDEDDISDQSSEDSSSDHEEDHCNTTNELDHEGRSCSSDDDDEEGRSCSSDEHDEEGEDAHDEEERSCSSDDHDEEGEEDISEKHPLDHDVYSGSDEDGAYEISQKCQRKSIKSRCKENNMLSDDESIYSSSTRSSTSSAANDE